MLSEKCLLRESFTAHLGQSLLLTLLVVAVLLVAAIGVVGVVTGWIDFSRDNAGDRTGIDVDTSSIRQAATETADSATTAGKAMSEQVGHAMKKVGERLERKLTTCARLRRSRQSAPVSRRSLGTSGCCSRRMVRTKRTVTLSK